MLTHNAAVLSRPLSTPAYTVNTALATQVMKYVSYHTVGRAVGYIRLCHNLLVSSAGFIILAMRL